MEENNTNVQPQTGAPTPLESQMEPKSSIGSVVGIIIVIALLILGAAYVWQTRIGNNAPADSESSTVPDAITEDLKIQSTSTEPDAIEKDLLNTNVDGLGADLGALLINTQ